MSMFELKVKCGFAAAHHIEGYPGDCVRNHGHNWVIEVEASSQELDHLGLAIDFRDLKRGLREVIARWDHQDLNTLPDFVNRNPTAEVIAQTCYERLQPLFTDRKTGLKRVTVWENDSCAASYIP